MCQGGECLHNFNCSICNCLLYAAAGEVEKRITYSRNQLIIIKLFGNGCNIAVPGIPESLCRRIRKNKN